MKQNDIRQARLDEKKILETMRENHQVISSLEEQITEGQQKLRNVQHDLDDLMKSFEQKLEELKQKSIAVSTQRVKQTDQRNLEQESLQTEKLAIYGNHVKKNLCARGIS